MRICGCELGCDFFFFKQKTAYELRISDGVQTCALPICSMRAAAFPRDVAAPTDARPPPRCWSVVCYAVALPTRRRLIRCRRQRKRRQPPVLSRRHLLPKRRPRPRLPVCLPKIPSPLPHRSRLAPIRRPTLAHLPTTAASPKRSEEHTSELQSLMRISYAVFCLKKKNKTQ